MDQPNPAATASGNTSQSKQVLLLCLLLALATAAVYWPVARQPFTNYDDPDYVTANPEVQQGITWNGLAWAFGQLHRERTYWHPLTWVSHMADCQLFGLNPAGHHLVNLLLHILNTVLVCWVFWRMTGAPWRCALLAGLFALHPLQVDTVAWVAERKNLLSAMFWLLTIWAYGRYAEKPVASSQWPVISGEAPTVFATDHGLLNTDHRPENQPHAAIFYLLSLCFFVCGLMCKPVLVTLPFVLLLLDYWPLGRLEGNQKEEGGMPNAESANTQHATRNTQHASRFTFHAALRLLAEKLPFLALAAASSAITIAAHHALGATSDAASGLSLGARIGNAAVSYVRYLGKAIWPSNLAVFYPHPGAWPIWDEVGCALVLLAVSGAVIAGARRRRYLFAGWFWFLGVLVPFIGLIQAGEQAMADRFAYVPLIGLFIMLAWGLGDWSRGKPRPGGTFAAGAMLCLSACGVLTWHQLGYWRNTETLFRHDLAVTRDNYVAFNDLGAVLLEQGNVEEAERQFAEAVRVKPDFAEALGNLGLCREKEGQWTEAEELFERSLKARPGADAHYNLANLLWRQGKLERAATHYEAALRCEGKSPDGAEPFREAAQARPDARAQYCQALALESEGHPKEAAAHYREAARLSPGTALYLNDLAWFLATNPKAELRDGAEAMRMAQRACELSGGKEPRFWGTLDAAYAEAGRFGEALAAAAKTRELALAAGQVDVARQAEERMALYRAGKPCRMAAPGN